MITPELNQYVNDARQAGIKDDTIREELEKQGWKLGDIEQALTGRERVPFTPQVSAYRPPEAKLVEELSVGPKRHGILWAVLILVVLIGGVMTYLYKYDRATYDALMSQVKLYSDGKTWGSPNEQQK